MQPSIIRETILDRRQPVIRWGAIFAGGAVAIAIWVLLQTLGMGICLATIDVTHNGWLRSVGIGTTVWSVISPIIAMFVGGLIAARFATTRVRRVGSMHGVVMWALASVVGLGATVWIVTMLVVGTAKVGGAALETGANAVSNIDAGDAMSALGVTPDDMLGPINQKLQQQGKPAVTATQLQETMRAVARESVRKGGFDHETLVNQLAANTSLSRQDAEDVANQLDAQAQRMIGKMNNVAERGKQTINSAAGATGKVLFGAGLTLLLSLGAAALGGAAGIRRERDLVTPTRTIETPVVPPPVYPPSEL